MSSGGLPAGLRFGATGLTSSAATNGSTNTTATPPTSSTSTGQTSPSTTNANGTSSSNDPTNYAGVFAQMLNMMSNQNIVYF